MSEIARIAVPTEFPNDEFATVLDICLETGDHVEAEDVVVVIEFSKATVEIESPVSGYVRILCEPLQEVGVGHDIALVFATQEEAVNPATEESASPAPANEAGEPRPRTEAPVSRQEEPPQTGEARPGAEPVFSKKAKELLEANGISPDRFASKAFVRSGDVLDLIQGKAQAQVPEPRKKPDAPRPGVEAREASSMKRAEVQNLQAGQNLITSTFRKSVRAGLATGTTGAAFGNLGPIPTILREACLLLKKHKHFNAYYQDGTIYYYEKLQLGYAVDLGNGLQLVNLGDLSGENDKSIHLKIMTGVKDYMRGTLSTQEMAKITATVTDLSNEGVDFFTPLIGARQSVALGICSTSKENGRFNLSLTFDHRVTEGRQAAIFLRELAAALEKAFNPE